MVNVKIVHNSLQKVAVVHKSVQIAEVRDSEASLSKGHKLCQHFSFNTGQMLGRMLNLSDTPGAEPAGKHFLTLSYMERFYNVMAFIAQCDIYICRTFITVQQFGKANRHSFWLFVLFYRLPHGGFSIISF